MKIRLLAPTQLNGHVHQTGDVVDWPDDVKPPHRMRQMTADRIDYDPANGLDANRIAGQMVDEPLYVEVKEDRHG